MQHASLSLPPRIADDSVNTGILSCESPLCSDLQSPLPVEPNFVSCNHNSNIVRTRVNITSPTGIQEINRLNKVNIEKDVIDFVEKSLQ